MISMHRFPSLCVLAAMVTLSACGGQSDTVEAENESVESVAAKVADSDLRPRPGQWESTMQIESLEMPGLDPQMQDMMKQQMGRAQTFTSCLTPEQAARPDAEFFQPGESDCTYEKFSMGGGEIDSVMTCAGNGAMQTMTMTGTYSEESYAMNLTAEGEMEQGQPMSMAMTVKSRRVGECDGTEG